MLRALIDADMLLYEVCFGRQFKGDDGELVIASFDNVIELLERKLTIIMEETWADEYTLYLTGSDTIKSILRDCDDKPLNFRIERAVTLPYKGNRSPDKPFHFRNLLVQMLFHYPCKVAWGIEADDLLCVDHKLDREGTIIGSRDKDLRTFSGNHYGWECNKQAAFGPTFITEGEALYSFYMQVLTGDKQVDNIPGLKGIGAKKAAAILTGCTTEEEMFNATAEQYQRVCGNDWRDYMHEQIDLLYMVNELDAEGNPVFHVMYDER